MKKTKKWAFTLLLLCLGSGLPAQSRLTEESNDTYDQRMEWFGKAKLGIFIHWGIYAVRGVPESWSFYNDYLPYEEYMKQQSGFKAEKYRPEEWVKLIKESGAKYAVITAKHHDGFALWDTKAGQLSAKKSAAAKRDLLTPFTDEVRRQGLRLGLYYSLLDWSRDDYPNKTKTTKRYDIKDDPARWQSFCSFNFAQLKELNNAYKPDLFWFDGDWEQSAEDWNSKGIVDLLRTPNPEVIINSRIQGYGDYATPEQGVPVVRPKEKYWELCYTMNDSWGYQPTDTNYKSTQMLLRSFVDCLSMGGNMLLDIGPKADGTIPPQQVEILKAFGRWTSKHKEAIYETRAGIPAEHFHGGYTTLNREGNILYLYLPNRPNGPVELKGIANGVHRAWVVGNGSMLNHKVYNKLYWSSVPGIVYIDVPEECLDEQITVIAVLLDGPIKLYRGEGQVISVN
ncbi:MAG: alpha-L-fucosidase [Bacteroidaceae bacterium]|nr:alpha-L-fucosidase [Prevotellaceae bacterium]MDY5631661.1 alpha-L-fucosidase [Bacteroidaceae bacterium]